MKSLSVFFISLIIPLGLFAQSLTTKEKIKIILNKSSNQEQLLEVWKYANKYKDLKRFFPDINPLNPIKSKGISSQYGLRFHPIKKVTKKHHGIDLAANLGTPIHAAAAGKVKLVRFSNKGYGNIVKISHKFGFLTVYAHLQYIVVKKNQVVDKGDIIGSVGSTGLSTGAHLHYEVRKNNVILNPSLYIILD